jgi:hypothetical protein
VALGGAVAWQHYSQKKNNAQTYSQAELDALNTKRKAQLAAQGKPTTPAVEDGVANAGGGGGSGGELR